MDWSAKEVDRRRHYRLPIADSGMGQEYRIDIMYCGRWLRNVTLANLSGGGMLCRVPTSLLKPRIYLNQTIDLIHLCYRNNPPITLTGTVRRVWQDNSKATFCEKTEEAQFWSSTYFAIEFGALLRYATTLPRPRHAGSAFDHSSLDNMELPLNDLGDQLDARHVANHSAETMDTETPQAVAVVDFQDILDTIPIEERWWFSHVAQLLLEREDAISDGLYYEYLRLCNRSIAGRYSIH